MRMPKSLLCALLIAVFFSAQSYAAAPDRIASAIDTSKMVALPNHVSPMARPEFDRGPVEPSRSMRITMLFVPSAQQEQALQQLIAEQQDKKSPNFHKWLSPEEYAQRFGLSQGDIDKISAWLESQGFRVRYVARGRDFLSFDGNAVQVESVFRTAIHSFSVNGRLHFANTTSPMIPAVLNGVIGGFRGLHDFFPHPMLKQHPGYTVTINNSTYHFLAPGDIATIYDINSLYQASPAIDGTGEKVVIAGQSDVYLADLNDFRTAFGFSSISGCTMDPTKTIIQAGSCSSGNFEMVVPGTASDPGLSPGDLSESDLDIEWIGSVARGAEIVFVTSSNGVDDSASWAIDNKLAPVISYSYGLCEAFVTAPSIATDEATYQKATTEGISMFAAAGDSAAAECDGDNGTYPAQLGLSVSYPASSSYVTGVGGTEFDEGSGSYWNASNSATGGSAKSYIPETAWNDSALPGIDSFDGTGGGPSNCAFGSGMTSVSGPNGGPFSFEICNAPASGGFPKPSWQTGITPSDSVRDVPDISFSASNVNDVYIVCAPQSEVVNGSTSSTSTCVNGINSALTQFNPPSAFGGTSAATPVAAGMAVLANQYLNATSGLGSINQQLYTLYKSNPSAFHATLSTNNTTTGGTSNNIVPCSGGDPTFEPKALQCPATSGTLGQFGYSVTTGYSTVTGLGSLDINAFLKAWAASLPSFTLSPSPTVLTAAAGANTNTTTITIVPVNGFTGSVAFTCPSGLPTGATCVFNSVSATSATLYIQTSANMATVSNVTVTVKGTGTGGLVSATTTVSLTVTKTTMSFSLSSNPKVSTLSVAQGQTSGPVNLTVVSTSTPSFIVISGTSSSTALPLTYSCSGLPSEATCNFSPSPPTPQTTVTLTIATTAPTTEMRGPFDRGTRIFYALLLPGLLGIVFTAGSRRRSLRGMRLLGLIVLLGLSTLWLGSCGGSGGTQSNPGTPTGTYTITVNATTGGASPLSNSMSFTLSVN